MESLEFKYEMMKKSLTTLEAVIKFFDECKKNYSHDQSKKNAELLLYIRDSMIQRFEFNTDLLWKYLKFYLATNLKFPVQANSPKEVVREVVKVALITEQQGKSFIKMLDCRNLTSHTYHEDTAQEVANDIPSYYLLMREIIKKTQP